MDIVTQEQINKLDGLIRKYRNQQFVTEAIEGENVVIPHFFDVTCLRDKRKNWITLEQCQNIVNAVLALLKVIPNDYHLPKLVTECDSKFCFRHLYFLDTYIFKEYTITHGFYKETISALIREMEMGNVPDSSIYDCSKITTTYTNLDKFIEYIKKSDEVIQHDFLSEFYGD